MKKTIERTDDGNELITFSMLDGGFTISITAGWYEKIIKWFKKEIENASSDS